MLPGNWAVHRSRHVSANVWWISTDVLISLWFIYQPPKYQTFSSCNQQWYLTYTAIRLIVGINTLRPRLNGRHFADDIFKRIFVNENAWISIKISLKFVPKVRINNIPTLVQIMAWRRPGDKPLSEPMMNNLLTHICVTRPQWVKDPVGGHRRYTSIFYM